MRADPYGEYQRSKTKEGGVKHVRGAERRERFLEAINVEIDDLQRRAPTELSYAGPGFMRSTQKNQRQNLNLGWESKDELDPVFSDYSIICPHLPGFVQPYKEHDGWIVYRAPTTITDQIGHVRMVEYQSDLGPGTTKPKCTVKPVQLPAWAPGKAPNLGRDHLYCFEGGTGGKKIDEGKIWSLMGFILAAEDTSVPAPTPPAQRPYDVFIVFRGSRSGRLSKHHRIIKNALGSGNPDWVTDLSFATTKECHRVSLHETHSGFAVAMQTCLPTIEAAIRDLVAQRPAAPRNIYVTGHSLGGALANCFASAMLCGSTRKDLQQAAPNWPWTSMCVWTFAAPPTGHEEFSRDFDLAVTTGWGTAANWRLKADLVPTGFLKLNYSTVGTDVCLPSKWYLESPNGEQSHSPDWMRKVMEYHLSQPPHSRRVDNQTPWEVKNDYKKLIVTVSDEVGKLTPANRKFYKFKEGLKIYLSAISRMKGDPRQASSKGKLRFTDEERSKISNFLGALGRTTLDTAANYQFVKDEFRRLVLDHVAKIQDGDNDLLLLLKLWLALIAAEDGYNWAANDRNLDAVGQA
ncbi:MAG: lipase family protein [Bryobacteraceae bacterium]